MCEKDPGQQGVDVWLVESASASAAGTNSANTNLAASPPAGYAERNVVRAGLCLRTGEFVPIRNGRRVRIRDWLG